MSECNRPGKTEDYCRKIPVEKDGAASPGQQALGKAGWSLLIALDALAPCVETTMAPPPGFKPSLLARRNSRDPAPPPFSVLRVEMETS